MLKASDGSLWTIVTVSSAPCEVCKRKSKSVVHECVEGKWAGVRVVACPEHAERAIEQFIAGGKERCS
jgi:hypothetical protein